MKQLPNWIKRIISVAIVLSAMALLALAVCFKGVFIAMVLVLNCIVVCLLSGIVYEEFLS